jgi:hypothetical protein
MVNVKVNIFDVQVDEIDEYVPVIVSETAVLSILTVTEFIWVKLTEPFFVLVY